MTTDVHRFSTAGSALVTEDTDLGSAGFSWLYPRACSRRSDPGHAEEPRRAALRGDRPLGDVDRYLAGVSHTLISEFFEDETELVAGGSPDSPPEAQGFWVAGHRSGRPDLLWESDDGSWTVVVMNADGRAGIAVGADLGATMPALTWVGVGVLAAGEFSSSGGCS